MGKPRESGMSSEANGAEPQSVGRLGLMGLTALGVVFGDIGTSPLYTLKTVLDYTGPHPLPADTLGALSLILWTLFLIITVGLFGAALIYGDGAITPAISVLSALEGVEQIAPSLQTYVLPAATVILLALF